MAPCRVWGLPVELSGFPVFEDWAISQRKHKPLVAKQLMSLWNTFQRIPKSYGLALPSAGLVNILIESWYPARTAE